jgi:hypothetical protein
MDRVRKLKIENVNSNDVMQESMPIVFLIRRERERVEVWGKSLSHYL